MRQQSRVLGIWLGLFGIFFLGLSAAFPDAAVQSVSSPPAYPSVTVALPQVHSYETVSVPADFPDRGQAIRPTAVEDSSGVTLDRLRRELYRYPDQDLAGRFVELLTERPPLFGSDE